MFLHSVTCLSHKCISCTSCKVGFQLPADWSIGWSIASSLKTLIRAIRPSLHGDVNQKVGLILLAHNLARTLSPLIGGYFADKYEKFKLIATIGYMAGKSEYQKRHGCPNRQSVTVRFLDRSVVLISWSGIRIFGPIRATMLEKSPGFFESGSVGSWSMNRIAILCFFFRYNKYGCILLCNHDK